jgi:hypothetical protein
MMLFQCSWTTVTLISACKELMLDVFSSIGEDVMVGVGCTARRDARNSDLLKIDEIDPTYAWTLPPARLDIKRLRCASARVTVTRER